MMIKSSFDKPSISFQIKVDDFYNYDWIFGMDYYNIELLSSMKPQDSKAEIELLGQYDPEGETIIEDPYFVSLTIYLLALI